MRGARMMNAIPFQAILHLIGSAPDIPTSIIRLPYRELEIRENKVSWLISLD
jgi:hypothetical protein